MTADDDGRKPKSLLARLRGLSIQDLFERTRVPGPPRSIFVNQELPAEYYDPKKPEKVLKQHRYTPNQIITSKYTVLTFLPRNLLEQFRRVANIFFLVIAILQFNSKFSTISPGLVILPLIVVLAITALKDVYEDFGRHRSDRRVNYSPVRILAGPGYRNDNAMSAKSRTFVRALPFRRKRNTDGPKRAADTEVLAHGAPAGAIDSARRNEQQAMASTGPDETHHHHHGLSQMLHHDHEEAGPYWETSIWENLKVGDIVKLSSNEAVPADILVCATSEEENVAFVETKNLDGETNLKSRSAVAALTHLRSAQDCAADSFVVEADRPELLMHKLDAAVVTNDGTRHAVDLNNVLLRGTIVRNTTWLIGVVMYTGFDTKLVLNAGGTPSKRGRVERQMDPMVTANLVLLALMATVCAIVDSVLEHRFQPRNAPWLYNDNRGGDNPSVNGVITWVFALITFQNIVPISLYISIEVVRTAQAAFIYFDREMYYAKTDTPTLARSFVLSDDLGQIEYIFSDKTGTLTQNAMVFRRASVGGIVYLGAEDDTTEDDASAMAAAKLKEMESVPPSSASTSGERSSGSPNMPMATLKPWDARGVKLSGGVLQRFASPSLSADIDRVAAHDTTSFDRKRIEMFWTVLALCHTVLAGVDPATHQVEYKAQSPDEAALVQAAADVGFEFRGRDRDVLYLRTPFAPELARFRLLNILDFTSARKRMSVLLRAIGADGEDVGPVLLFAKGADNVIFERLQSGNADAALRRETERHLDEFASSGLRTLTLAYRTIGEDDYQRWNAAYLDATATLENREERVEEVSSAIEQGLKLLGATAIEDRLQDGVPETIADLKRAGIRVWVLTGDKLETAIAIGHSTNLIAPDANIVIIRGGKGGLGIYEQMLRAARDYFPDAGIFEDPKVDTGRLPRPSMAARRTSDIRDLVGDNNGQKPGGYVLVIDGLALEDALRDPEHRHLLLRLGTLCSAVVCCRVSPKQKALVVRLVKDGLPGTMTLAIGDGANDVSMIQAADVGVGISGEEGLQAVNSADYAIAQFRFLKRLLLVHGHWSYYRNGNMITNFFYKNIICIGVLWWFQIYCAWSSAYYFEYVYLLFWNSFWTIAPVIGIGIFDRLIDDRVLMAQPELYRYGREQRWFSTRLFLVFMGDGVVQSAIIFFLGFYAYNTTTTRADGYEVFQFESSTTLVIAAAMAASLFNGLNTNAWTWWIVFAVSLGPVLIWLWTAIYSIVSPETAYSQTFGDDPVLFTSPTFWFVLILTILLALLPRYLYKAMTFLFDPTDIDILRWNNRLNPRMAFDTEAQARQTQQHQDAMEMTPRRRSTAEPGGMAPLARTQTMGSQIDMSTGVRGASRGFGFSAEEGGVEMRRIQSHLSSTSALAGPGAARKRSRGSRVLQSIRRPLTLRRKERRPTEIGEDDEGAEGA